MAEYIWNGSDTADISGNDTANFTPEGAPTTGDSITFDGTGSNLTMLNGTTAADIIITPAASFGVGAQGVTANGAFTTQAGATLITGNGGGTLTFGGSAPVIAPGTIISLDAGASSFTIAGGSGGGGESALLPI